MKIEKEVKAVIAEITAADKIDLTDRLADDLGMDSFSTVSMFVMLEERLEITFDESDMDMSEIETVEDVVRLTEKSMESV